MAQKEERGETLKNEEALLKMKYEENNKITRKFMQEMNEMKSKMDDYDKHGADGTPPPPDVKRRSVQKPPVRTSEFNTFMKIIDHHADGSTVEEYKTVTSKEVTIKNYVLQKELDRLNGELARRDDACDRLEEENAKLREDRDRCAHQAASLREKIGAHDREIEALTGTLKARDAEVSRLLRDAAAAEKKTKHERIVHEKQRAVFAKSSDENRQLRETVKRLESSRRETEEKYGKTLARNDEALAKSVREKDALIVGFRKQLELIDSLKRQTVRSKLQEEIQAIENEFGKFLEGN